MAAMGTNSAGRSVPKEDAKSPEEVLECLTCLLGVNFLKGAAAGEPMEKNGPHEWSSIPWEPSDTNNEAAEDGEEEPEVDFSSFPSLSLERRTLAVSMDNAHRQGVQSHVSSLLSRPILASNYQQEAAAQLGEEGEEQEGEADNYMYGSADDNKDEEESDDFLATKLEQVPEMMLRNFFQSFSTLMNSRLRAYATFLARHGLALLDTSEFSGSSSDDLAVVKDGIVGVEQKLETMLEIGRLVSTNAIVTSFTAQKEQAKRTSKHGEEEEETMEVSMPIVMEAAIDITLPSPGDGQSGTVTVSFKTSGSITGIFSTADKKNPLLRVVQVDLNMEELLPCMMEQASSVISQIVEMTNALLSSMLPGLEEAQGIVRRRAMEDEEQQDQGVPLDVVVDNGRKRSAATLVEPEEEEESEFAIVSPLQSTVCFVQPKHATFVPNLQDLHDSDSNHTPELLTRESCESLVDYVLHDTKVNQPVTKRPKLVPTGDSQECLAGAVS